MNVAISELLCNVDFIKRDSSLKLESLLISSIFNYDANILAISIIFRFNGACSLTAFSNGV